MDLANVAAGNTGASEALLDYIRLRLIVAGYNDQDTSAADRLHVPYEVIAHLKERIRLSFGQHSPIEDRVQSFLNRYLEGLPSDVQVKVPGLGETFVLDRERMALELSLPETGDLFESDIVSSYRLQNGQGVLHNPRSDRRTTQGVFHVSEGGMPIPEDKVAVPRAVYGQLLQHALKPPRPLQTLPFTSQAETPFASLVSLMLRPLVLPGVQGGVFNQRSMEIQYVAPGNLVSNLDFLERIFGNAGDPYLPANDAGSDTSGWSGHTGYVVLAPHLTTITKVSLGLPKYEDATDRQRRDGMCWSKDDELYNGGEAFKLTARDEQGVIVTMIADNYYGYCKKEVKTQISFAANLMGYAEEEHAGGALVYPQLDLGKYFSVPTHIPGTDHSFVSVKRLLADQIDLQPGNYAIDRTHPDLIYVPETVEIDIYDQTASWPHGDGIHSLMLSPDKTYVVPSGFKIRLQQEHGSRQWRLVGTYAEGTFCHKPSTVSGGGKSEISKSISDQILYGSFYVADFEKDMDHVQQLLDHDYSRRFLNSRGEKSRDILSAKRSLGSVIKLLTPSATLYTPEYNTWLSQIPHAIRELIYIVKRLYRPELGKSWRAGFSVDIVNGRLGNELRYNDEKVLTYSMRVGFTPDDQWRTFTLRSDYVPSSKVQREDDITASAVVPATRLEGLNPRYKGPVSFKMVSDENPERRLFQRPDEAIHRGFDKMTEEHFGRKDNFFSNFAPLTADDARRMLSAPVTFGEFTRPMQNVIRNAAAGEGYFVSSASPRIVGGKPTKNPRYLQMRPDLDKPEELYLAATGTRMHRHLAPDQALFTPVNAVLPGRRLNPPDASARIRSLAVYGPIHYQETPELFMENISSLTGKSPSTTGAGSEGALTKGPFNALPPIIDLNNALVSHILTSTECFISAAGYVGPQLRVDHDISLLIPEIWSRMEVGERDPKYLIDNNYLELVEDFDYDGQRVLASRLGYRITSHFVSAFFGIVFDNPNDLFSNEMLRPELQDLESFVDGIENIVSTQRSIADNYVLDGSIDKACPPLKALLHIMRYGEYEGDDIASPAIRSMFTIDSLIQSDWYQERLRTQQQVDTNLWERHRAYLRTRMTTPRQDSHLADQLAAKLRETDAMLERISASSYVSGLKGFIGADPVVLPRTGG